MTILDFFKTNFAGCRDISLPVIAPNYAVLQFSDGSKKIFISSSKEILKAKVREVSLEIRANNNELQIPCVGSRKTPSGVIDIYKENPINKFDNRSLKLCYRYGKYRICKVWETPKKITVDMVWID